MEEYLRILDLAAHNALPEQINEESELPIAAVRELIDSGYLNAIDASSMDGNAYLRPRITLPGREYLKKLQAENLGGETFMYARDAARPPVFISHSSADSNIAEALVRLLRSALNLNPKDIRCTSVDGHRLPAGALTDQELREEIMTAKAMVGLISPGVMASAYVLFELGARWGAKLYLAPLLIPGAGAEILQGPIANMNALRCDSEHQLHQFLEELGQQLGRPVNSASAYLTDLQAVTQAVPRIDQNSINKELLTARKKSKVNKHPLSTRNNTSRPPDFDEMTEKILKIFFELSDNIPVDLVTTRLGIKEGIARYHFDVLRKQNFIDETGGGVVTNLEGYIPPRYGLTSTGRAYVVKNKL
jgi:hypothetical protein